MITSFDSKILDGLVKKGSVEQNQVPAIQKYLQKKGATLESVLMGSSFKMDKNVFLGSKSEIAGVPAYVLDEGVAIPKDVLSIIPMDAASQYKMIPLSKDTEKVVVGMVNPNNIKARDALNFIFLRNELNAEVVVITEKDFNNAFSLYKGLKNEIGAALENIEDEFAAKQKEQKVKSLDNDEDVANLKSAPVTTIVAVMLRHAIEGKASDVHIEALQNATRVRFRLDGDLHTSVNLPKSIHNAVIARVKVLASLKLDESRIPQDGRFTTELAGQPVDFRVSTFPTSSGEKAVLRVLDATSATMTFEELGLNDYHFQILTRALNAPYGMIIVSGPTGSGKTTTLYTALSSLNKEGVNMVSLEDPVEYHIEGMNQSQIRPDIGYTFASGLRHILRQDPDIIMVGEIRDSETAKLAIQSSLTGHLVFSTVHTNNVFDVVPRLLDMEVDAFLLPSSFALAVAQRLVGRLCDNCRIEVPVEQKMSDAIEKELSSVKPEILQAHNIVKPYKLYNAQGCAMCHQKKIKGRIAIYEMMEMTDEFKGVILKAPNEVEIKKEGIRQGVITMKQDGLIKALSGFVTFEDVVKKVEE